MGGDRIKYNKISGSGPQSGWVSTKVKGKETLIKHQIRIWLFCAGTRGDLQPFLALSIGLQRAGFYVAIWSCEDYRSFVESYGLPFFDICSSCEQVIKRYLCGMSNDKKASVHGDKQEEQNGLDWFLEESVRSQMFWTRFSLSALFGVPVKDV